MEINDLKQQAATELSKWQQHRFFMLIVLVIAVSMALVMISISLYNSSGAAQVDLSLPGYKSIQKRASQDHSETNFSSDGTLDSEAFAAFDKAYGRHLERLEGDNYDARPLSEESLLLLQATADEPAEN